MAKQYITLPDYTMATYDPDTNIVMAGDEMLTYNPDTGDLMGIRRWFKFYPDTCIIMDMDTKKWYKYNLGSGTIVEFHYGREPRPKPSADEPSRPREFDTGRIHPITLPRPVPARRRTFFTIVVDALMHVLLILSSIYAFVLYTGLVLVFALTIGYGAAMGYIKIQDHLPSPMVEWFTKLGASTLGVLHNLFALDLTKVDVNMVGPIGVLVIGSAIGLIAAIPIVIHILRKRKK